MQFVLEYAPIILFFVAYKLHDIYVATAVAIAASVVAIGWSAIAARKVTSMQWLSLVIIVVFGGATLLLHDETYIKWKPSVLYGAFALTLAVGKLVFGRDWIQVLFRQASIDAPPAVWTRTTWAWVAFLSAMAALNLYVARAFSLDAWVNFKVWWATGLFLAFTVGNVLWLMRYLPTGDPPSEPGAPPRP